MAQLVARGSSVSQAFIDVGFKNKTNAYRHGKKPEFRARVAEIVEADNAASSDVTVHHRGWINAEMRKLYDRCIQAVKVFDNKTGEPTGEWMFDAKHAVKLLEMFGLEQGMFKRHLDVTSRKVTMIEGSQKEILEKFAQLLERLGIGAISQLLNRLGHDTFVAAANLIGYEVVKANGKDVERIDAASGSPGDAGYSGKPDAQPLRTQSEAAPVS
jgi:hypothetical protein